MAVDRYAEVSCRAAGSRMGVEEVVPDPPEVIEALRAEEIAAGKQGTRRGRSAGGILDRLGRPLPGPESQASPMIEASRLVTAVKATVHISEVAVRLDS
ncbi:hypothetical protein KEK_04562 [Mycolicibacterium thermoresistibile ATCC 19527]|uniref:Uncharacterized protein n=2 Tax=Mycolicibacterium thermoresistibile TaxID=1797 RepID=G7CD64_MYCT3|nr:hypothetical protein [Mycolicibacterium thermoresistibile]EHI13888.1 hypothetical protein KEK_04562 [Mycolicibacterium thermoresistibile ATCC 19527]MCV7187491.1 hypothetical protein [Mycolicibacterium thermoresistibile]GAT17104.1 putative uncharacterized protein [Mycolicibacterium thermoresistibile]SNW16517.1 methyltransferase, putative, family protein [Mycolicibacterium thermoresistibile]